MFLKSVTGEMKRLSIGLVVLSTINESMKCIEIAKDFQNEL